MKAPVVRSFILLSAIFVLASTVSSGQQTAIPATTEGDFVAKDFRFRSGETLPELRLHYTTLGKPARDAQGRLTNAVLIDRKSTRLNSSHGMSSRMPSSA